MNILRFAKHLLSRQARWVIRDEILAAQEQWGNKELDLESKVRLTAHARDKALEDYEALRKQLGVVATERDKYQDQLQFVSSQRDTASQNYKSLCQVQDILVKELREARQFSAKQKHAADEARIEGALAERERIASRCDELAAEAERTRLSCEDEDWWGGRAYALRLIASESRVVKP